MSGTDSGPGSPLSASEPNGKPAASGGFTGDAVRSFLWAFAGFGGSRVVVFVTTLVLVRILSPDDFGTVAAALVLLEFINLVLELGLGASLVQEQATGHGIRVDSAFTMQMVSAISATAVLMLASPALASMLGIEGEADVLRGVSLAIVIRAAGQIHDALIQRELRFKTRTVVDMSRSLVRLVVSVVLALQGADAWALVIGMLASELTATVALWLLVPYRPRLRIGPAHLVSLLRFGGAVTGIRICSAVIASTDYLVIGGQLGPTALGFYVIAFRLPELLVENVLTVFSQVAFPVLSRARSVSHALMQDAVMRSLKLVTLFGFATGTGLAIVANDAVNVFFGPEWQPSVAPMVILSLAVGVGSLGYGVGDAYLALGRPMTRLWILVILMIPTVVAFIVVAPWGIVAVAWVHLAFAVVDSTGQLALARRIVGLSWSGLLDTLRGPIGATVGVIVTALPVALVMPTSAVALVATVCAGVAGAAVGAVGADRSIPAVVMDLVGTIRTRPV